MDLYSISTVDQFSFRKSIAYHLVPGLGIALLYILISNLVIKAGQPAFSALLWVELIFAPLIIIHLYYLGKKTNGGISMDHVLGYKTKLSASQYLLWTVLGILMCFVIYIPLYPVGLFLRENVFNWLPEWYFNPFYGVEDMGVVARLFLIGIFIDGIVGPVAEELFFRGFLLPRMEVFKKWAPVLNGTLFGLYHFWQPHNYLAVIGVGIIISYVVWKKKNFYLGIFIHCGINMMGAIGGYLAASGGEMFMR